MEQQERQDESLTRSSSQQGSFERGKHEPAIDEERQKTARVYARSRHWLFLSNLVVSGFYALVFLFGGLSVDLRDLAATLSNSNLAVVAIYFAIFYLGYTVVMFPLSALSGHVLPRRYGISTQSFSGWLADWAKGLGIGVIIGLAGVEIAYYLLATMPNLWWLLMGVIVLIFSIVLTNLAPLILVPLFYKMVPLEDESLTRRLVTLAQKANTKVKGVYRLNLSAKTSAANAALIGLGNTRRVVLGDTLLGKYTPEEVETVFAHELGHHVHRDIPKGIMVQSVLTIAGLYVASLAIATYSKQLGFTSPADVATLPLLTLTLGVVSLITMPISNGFSRWIEREADLYALEVTGNSRAFRNAMVRLANQNLAELDPGRLVEFFLYDHPAIGKRIAFAEERGRAG